MEKLSFKLEVFEGPLDLLLQLIKKNKVSIYDIPIIKITQQYFEVLEQMGKMDLEISSEFLVMAAQLLHIKSKMLLPKKPDELEEDPRGELVERLLEYQRYKELSEFLQEREGADRYLFFKEPEDISPQVMPYEGSYCVDDLISAFNVIVEKMQRQKPPPKKTFVGIVKREKVSVKDKLRHILSVTSKKRIKFCSLFETLKSKPEMVATFLALLELIKMKRVLVNYNKREKDFIIVSTGGNNAVG